MTYHKGLNEDAQTCSLCQTCKLTKGALLQCCVFKCKNKFHLKCAKQEKLLQDSNKTQDEEDMVRQILIL
jgi:hypothetical protein